MTQIDEHNLDEQLERIASIACDDIVGLLPDDNVVTKEFGYNSGEKKFGFRIGVAATIKAINEYREGL